MEWLEVQITKKNLVQGGELLFVKKANYFLV